MARWPIREALESFRGLMRRRALGTYMQERLEWAVLAPHLKRGASSKPPAVPDLLKEKPRVHT